MGISKFSHCIVIPDDTASEAHGISGDPTLITKTLYQHKWIGIGDLKVQLSSGTSYTMLRKEAFEPFLSIMLQIIYIHGVMQKTSHVYGRVTDIPNL